MNTANGSTVHSAAGPVPIASSSSAPATKPTAVPSSARIAVDPVDAAVVRSTDSVPSATQNPCCTPLTEATATAAAIGLDQLGTGLARGDQRVRQRGLGGKGDGLGVCGKRRGGADFRRVAGQ